MIVAVVVGPSIWRGTAIEGSLTHTVTNGQFRVSHFESGEVWAAKNQRITSPRVGGRLTIVHLWPEGEKVDVGDLILQFDRGEYENNVIERSEQLERAVVNLESSLADQRQKVTELEIQIEQRSAQFELTRISVHKAEYASPIEKETRQIRLKQAERSINESVQSLEARHLINAAQMANLQLRIAQAQKRYDKAKRDYERLTVYADRPGILVHEKMERGNDDRMEKIQVGDTVWGGMSILTFPDLSAMQVVSQVGEMDVHMIRIGLKTLIELEAFPGSIFHGEVSTVAPMAVKAPGTDNVQVFEMIVDVEEQDDRLFPGMSASVEVIVETLEDVIWAPMSALHQDSEGKTFVYQMQGRSFKSREVVVGKRNATAIVIEAGLQTGDVIALGKPNLN